MSIRTYQHQVHLRKITVIIIISGITLWAHFSQGIAKFDTLLTIINSWYHDNEIIISIIDLSKLSHSPSYYHSYAAKTSYT